MSTPLIFTQQRWLPYLVDVLLTAIAWAGFVYLFFTGFLNVIQHRVVPGEHLHFELFFATVETLLFYLLVGVINALILSIWAKYNQIRHGGDERRQSIPVLKDSQLISSFDISPQMLDLFHNHQIVTVMHDEQGGISRVAVGSATSVAADPSPSGPAAAESAPSRQDSATAFL